MMGDRGVKVGGEPGRSSLRRVPNKRAPVVGAASIIIMGSLACSSSEVRETRIATERDSAGVLILTHPAGDFSDTITAQPLLTIGQEGQPDYEFFRMGGVGSLASGNVVVANGGTHELRFYDRNGRHIRTVGRRGDGPSEFGFLSTFWIGSGDTIAVLDPRRRRIVYFDSAGTFVRGQSYAQDLTSDQPDSRGPCVFPGLMGLLEDGTRLTSGWGCMMFQGTDGRRPTVFPVDLVGEKGRTHLGPFNSGWVWERASPRDPRESFSIIPLSGRFTYAVGPEHIFFSEGADLEIQIFDATGKLVGLLREDAVPPEVTEADRRAYVEAQANTPRPHPSDVPFPDRRGSYSALKLSHGGELWARRDLPSEDGLQHWVVFSSDRRNVRRVVLPDFQVGAIRGGAIYGHMSDTLGIQTVMVLDGRS